jgi:hypothetical protein
LKYVQRRLPGWLSLPASAMDSVTVRTFAGRRSSYVRHVGIPVYGRLVLRLFFRRGHLERLASYRRLRWTYERREIPVPKVVFIDDSPATWRRYGFALLAEEFIDGEPLDELSGTKRAELLSTLAPIVANLHGVTSAEPGKPWVGVVDDVRASAQARFTRWLGRIQGLGIGPNAAHGKALTEWYADTLADLSPRRFPLIHGGLGQGNVLVVGGSRPVLTDVMAAEHWFGQWDLLLLEWLVTDEGERCEEAVDAYFAACGDEATFTRQVYERSRPVFAAAYYVHRASTFARHAVKGKRVPFEEAEQARRYWSRSQKALKKAGAP